MLYIFDKSEKLLTLLKNDGAACPYFDAVHKEQLNGENTFTFAIPAGHPDAQYVVEGNLVAFRDLDLDWQLFEIKRPVDVHDKRGLICTVYCEHAFYELLDDFITDLRPTGTSAHFALTQALTGTRWQVGTVADLGLNSTNYYYESSLSAVQKVRKAWGGELRFRVVVSGGVIAERRVDLLARRGADTGKQFTYGKDVEEVRREVDLSNLSTAMFGRGKGVEVETGGHGRRLTFADVEWSVASGNPVDKPLGQEWVGDPNALVQWGRPGNRHRFGVFEDIDETDPAALLQKTWFALQVAKIPRVSYWLSVLTLEQLSGYAHEKTRLGDTARVIDRKFSPALLVSARVIEISRDLLWPENTQVVLGSFAPSLADTSLEQDDINREVRDKARLWDEGGEPFTGPVPTTWLDGIIDILTNQLQSGVSNWYTDDNGNLVFETLDDTAAMMLTGNGFMLSNQKDPVTEEWIWRTFGTGDGFTADEINAGKIRTSLVQILGNSNFYWDGDYLYIINPDNLNHQIRLSKRGIRFTRDGGQTWRVAIDYDGIRMEGQSQDGHTHYGGDGAKVYDEQGNLVGHFGSFEGLGPQTATFARASTAFKQNGTLVTSGVPRYEYGRIASPRWSDTFDADSLSEYTSYAVIDGTVWSINDGVLTGVAPAGIYPIASQIKNNLLLQDFEVEITSDLIDHGGIHFCFQDNNNFYFLRLGDSGSTANPSDLTLIKRVNAAQTTLKATVVNWPRGTAKSIKLTKHGSLIEAWFDGVKMLSVVDTALSSGGVGLRCNHGTNRYLDFAVYQVIQAIMIEEGTTNLLTANQASVETDLTGLAMTGTHGNKGTLSRITTDAWHGSACAQVVVSGFEAGNDVNLVTRHPIDGESKAVAVSPSTAYTFSAYGKAPAGIQWQITVIEWNTSGEVVKGTLFPSIYTGTGSNINDPWQYAFGVLTTEPTTAFVSFRLRMQGNGTFKFDGLQIEQKAHPTSWHLAGTSRVNELLTIPTAGVLSPTEGDISISAYIDPATMHGNVNPKWSMLFSVATVIASPYSENNQISIRRTAATSNWRVYFSSSDGVAASIDLGNITTPGWYRFDIIWKSGVGGYVYLNGVYKGVVAAHRLPTVFASSMYMGCWVTTTLFHNNLIGDFRVRNKMRTSAEIIADYSSGQPLPVDVYTTCKMSFDGHLQPTVQTYGLFSKNGRQILQDPQVGQGIEVWDGGVRKVLIGRLDDNSIGQEIRGGAIYATVFSTRLPGETKAFAELLPNGDFKIFDVNAALALLVSGGSGQGKIDWHLSGTKYSEMWVDAGTNKDLVIRSARSDSGVRLEGPNGTRVTVGSGSLGGSNTVGLKSNDYVWLDGDEILCMWGSFGNTELRVYGDIRATGNVYGAAKLCTEKTSQGTVGLHARESPEHIYVDDGRAELVNGECRIDLDPIYLECIEPESEETPWCIHLTPKGPFTVYEAEIGDSYFIVRSHELGVNGKFTWKISATRKNKAGVRFTRVDWDKEDAVLESNWEDELLVGVV